MSSMIIGIGTDIVNIERLERIFSKYGDSFLNKNFHALEIKKFYSLTKEKQIPYLAKRFAAKEAVSKALGTGISGGLAFSDIAIINNDSGLPGVVISSEKFPNIAQHKFQISLSDDYPFAVAFVVMTR